MGTKPISTLMEARQLTLIWKIIIKEQYLKLIDFAITNGTNYFTFNIPNSKCEDCGKIIKDPLILVPVVVAIILLNIHELSDIYAQLKHLEVIDNKRLETVYIVMVNPRYEICRYKNSVSRIA